MNVLFLFFFFQAEDGIRDIGVTGVQTCALPIFTLLFAVLTSNRTLGISAAIGVAVALLFGLVVLPAALVCVQIGRASCRERVEISGVAVSLKKKKILITTKSYEH